MATYRFIRTETVTATYYLEVEANDYYAASAKAEVGPMSRIREKESVTITDEGTSEKTVVICNQYEVGSRVRATLSNDPFIVREGIVKSYGTNGRHLIEFLDTQMYVHVDDLAPL